MIQSILNIILNIKGKFAGLNVNKFPGSKLA